MVVAIVKSILCAYLFTLFSTITFSASKVLSGTSIPHRFISLIKSSFLQSLQSFFNLSYSIAYSSFRKRIPDVFELNINNPSSIFDSIL